MWHAYAKFQKVRDRRDNAIYAQLVFISKTVCCYYSRSIIATTPGLPVSISTLISMATLKAVYRYPGAFKITEYVKNETDISFYLNCLKYIQKKYIVDGSGNDKAFFQI